MQFERGMHSSRVIHGRDPGASILLLLLIMSLSLPVCGAPKPRVRSPEPDLLPAQKSTLQDIIAAAKESRTSKGAAGISVLLTCADRGGKTVATDMLGKELGLDLYPVDLSKVVSKYVGETEKNLRRVFATTESRRAILVFDEADALFGKRTEVKDSHDRYANIEVNYLLQQIEKYHGIAVLTTNQRDEIDQAFRRRFRFVLELC